MPQGADGARSNVSSGHPALFPKPPIFDILKCLSINTDMFRRYTDWKSQHSQNNNPNQINKKYQFPSGEWWEGSRLTTASPEWYLTGEGRSTSSPAWCPGLPTLHNATHTAWAIQWWNKWQTPHKELIDWKGRSGKQKYFSPKRTLFELCYE